MQASDRGAPGANDPAAPIQRSGQGAELALVMSGGGARGAYQVGFLQRVARELPDLSVPIVTGVSAGGINAAFLANAEGTFEQRCAQLGGLWRRLRGEDVFRSSPQALLPMVLRWGLRLVTGGLGGRSDGSGGGLRGLVDTAPLADLLTRELQAPGGRLTGIERNLAAGRLRAIALTSASYSTGDSVTWIEGRGRADGELADWRRGHRRSVHDGLTVDHVLASASLPLFFPAVHLAGARGSGRPGGAIPSGWYGDGGMRLTAPFSPAIRLGASRVLAISTRHSSPLEAPPPERAPSEPSNAIGPDAYPPPAQILGTLLNSIFLDQFEGDALRLERINELLAAEPARPSAGDMRPVELLVLRPSQDLGALANDYEARLPRTFRFLTRGLGTQRVRSNDLLSLVMFQADYVGALLALGERDAEAQLDRVCAFLQP